LFLLAFLTSTLDEDGLHNLPVLPPEKETLHSLDRRLTGPHSQSEYCEDYESLAPARNCTTVPLSSSLWLTCYIDGAISAPSTYEYTKVHPKCWLRREPYGRLRYACDNNIKMKLRNIE
jgi:hypothetical protein